MEMILEVSPGKKVTTESETGTQSNPATAELSAVDIHFNRNRGSFREVKANMGRIRTDISLVNGGIVEAEFRDYRYYNRGRGTGAFFAGKA